MSPSIEGLISLQDGAAHRLAMALTPADRERARAEYEAASAAVRVEPKDCLRWLAARGVPGFR